MAWQDNLTLEQQQAVSSIGVHARLLAGPGTGKTLVLTRRVLYLVHDIGVTPSDILVLTFTRAAAAELKRRIANEFSNEIMPHISTLHSYALRLILQQGASGRLPTPIRIADDFEERFIIEEDLKRIMGLSRVTEARELLNQLSADWERLSVDEENYRAPNPQFYGAWQEHRQIFGYTLRAELVYQLKHALEEGIVDIDQRPKHILVDEYQDLNPCDLAVIKRLAEHGAELYVAGDDDQSIYGFRYADPEGIRRFDKDYIPSVSLDLKECKRCGSQILALANYVANQDPRRLPKTITPAAEVPSGEVHILNFTNQSREADAIARICKWLVVKQNIQPEQILILLRSDRNGVFSKPIRRKLEQLDVPVGIAVDPLEPLNSKEGRQFLSILRLTANDNDHLAWRTLLKLRKNSIGDEKLNSLYELARNQGKRFAEVISVVASNPASLPGFGQSFVREVENIRQAVTAAKAALQNTTSLIDAIKEIANKYIPSQDVRQRVITLFEHVIEVSSARDIDELLRSINVSLGDAEQEQQSNAVNIMTMHQAKGLTAQAVIVVGAEDEYIPGRAQGQSIDDERRLLYVSLTRARRYLYVTHCRQRLGKQQHTGKNAGQPRRTLTRFLSGGPVRTENGEDYIKSL